MGTTIIIDGSALCAAKTAKEGSYPFSSIHIGDNNIDFLESVEKRLENLSTSVNVYNGNADITADKIRDNLNPSGLHFGFLDPYNLKTLPFSIIENLAEIERIDILMHVSVNDLQRNLAAYMDSSHSALDTFSPGWRKVINSSAPHKEIRSQVLRYWLDKIRKLRMQPSGVESIELVSGTRKQPLYWLVFAARHDKANEFWEKIRDIDPQKSLGL